jgi:hypothetical protein
VLRGDVLPEFGVLLKYLGNAVPLSLEQIQLFGNFNGRGMPE